MAINWNSVARGYMSGGIPGAVGGYFSGKEEDKARAAQEEGMQRAQADNERIRQEMLSQRQHDLSRVMGFFQPAQQALERLYGVPMSAWGGAQQAPPPGPQGSPMGPMTLARPGAPPVTSAPAGVDARPPAPMPTPTPPRRPPPAWSPPQFRR